MTGFHWHSLSTERTNQPKSEVVSHTEPYTPNDITRTLQRRETFALVTATSERKKKREQNAHHPLT
jgi:hypothetical protein